MFSKSANPRLATPSQAPVVGCKFATARSKSAGSLVDIAVLAWRWLNAALRTRMHKRDD